MLKFNLVTVGDMQNITVLVEGELLTASSEHPNFSTIVAAVLAGEEDIADLFDMQKAINKKFERLSERVMVRNGRAYFDGEEVDNSLTRQIIRFMEEGEEDFKPLVAFMEKVMINPNENSREQLYEWLSTHEFTITDAGDIVAYKGTNLNADGVPVSTYQAPEKDQVTVNGEPVIGFVENVDGAIVEMPRSIVDNREDVHCSVGLHVGTWAYASAYAPHVLEVHVNPRDVVSVTSDSNRQKIRCCRYRVVSFIKNSYSAPVIASAAFEEYDEDFDDWQYLDDCDLYECDCDDSETYEVAEPVTQDVTKAITVNVTLGSNVSADDIKKAIDTRLNHLSQQRYPKGHPKAGQFVPKGLSI